MAHPQPPPSVPPATGPDADPTLIRPRGASPDTFEQNPISQLSERLSRHAAGELDETGRVREALRLVTQEGVTVAEAARLCNVAPSFLAAWREKYVELLDAEPSIAPGPLLQKGAVAKGADLVHIPEAARAHFLENWERLVEHTRANPATFKQNRFQLFLENSALTRWLYEEGKLDRGAFAGVTVVLITLVMTAGFLMAGRHRSDPPEAPRPPAPENTDTDNQGAAEVARQFFAAPTAEEKMRFVRPDPAIRPLMEEYFHRYPALPITDAVLTRAMPGTRLYALEFDIPSLKRKHLCVMVEHDGKFLMDWETSSMFQEVHLQDIRTAKSPTPARIAVRVTRDSYFNYGFTEARFSCYRLKYPGLEMDLYAYTPRDSPDDQTLSVLLKPVGTESRSIAAILEIKYPAGKDVADNQVELLKIVSEEWVVAAPR